MKTNSTEMKIVSCAAMACSAFSDNKIDEFRKELEFLLNSKSMENRSNTPDFILAQYLTDCLLAHDRAVNRREVWYGREPEQIFSSPK